MKIKLITLLLPVSLAFLLPTACGYKERGHSNTPAENPGSQTKVGVDTIAHPGNIDQDTIHPEN